MNSKVIKFVAGAGKTTYSLDYLKCHRNGLYLAFNNSVVNVVANMGYLGKTIDSLFQGYIIPKFTSQVPIIANGARVEFLNVEELTGWRKGIGSIRIQEDGRIYNHNSETGFSMYMSNYELHQSRKTNSRFVQFIFDEACLRLTNELRTQIMFFLIKNYGEMIVDLIRIRFDYVIVDEAQDLNRAKEVFIKLLYDSGMKMIVLGDEYQNINSGGDWFSELIPSETRNVSFRCPEGNCSWIRDNLGIQIYGNDNCGQLHLIDLKDVKKYDNGKRCLLYNASYKNIMGIIENWNGPALTIKSAKGDTIPEDIVIVGKTLNVKALYTAITRTTADAYSTIVSWS